MSIFLFLLVVGLSAVAGPALGRDGGVCPPFSCGQLHNLTWPFRLKDYPPSCGNDLYQLSCTDEKAIMYVLGVEMHLTQVWYTNSTFWLVNPSLSNSSNCRLPSPPSPPSSTRALIAVQRYKRNTIYGWFSFMNCTEPIGAHHYVPVHCSSHSSSYFVYAAFSDYEPSLQLLGPTCRYLTTAGVSFDILEFRNFNWNDSNALFEILQKGSPFSFPYIEESWRYFLDNCLYDSKSLFLNQTRGWKLLHFLPALVKSEYSLLVCINDYYYQKPVFWRALFVVVMMLILQFLIITLILGRFIFSMSILWFYLFSIYCKRDQSDAVEAFLRNQQMRLSPTRYTYADMIIITRKFKEKLGQGGFGTVFKGELPSGVLVAVKLLGVSKQDGEDFISEVSTIGSIYHVNIVKLVGFCADGSKRALVYEYMANGSLDKLIFSPDKSHAHRRRLSSSGDDHLINVALGAARGIDYLHRGCEMQILHFDIKPHNILLDHNLTPKVSDFGLARLYPRDNDLVSVSAARGTIGYIAPELISRSFGIISYKSDVYSFGMLLLEMAGGRRNADPLAENLSEAYYPSWIYEQLLSIFDSHKEIEYGDVNVINEIERKLAIVGLWCIQLKPSERPTMSKVIEMLEDDVKNLTMPRKPFFSSMDPISVHQSRMDSSFTQMSTITES